MYLTEKAFTGQAFGYAATIAWVMFLVIALSSGRSTCCSSAR